MSGLWLLWALVAHGAGPLDPYAGEWGLDPAASDNPLPALSGMVKAPATTGGAARAYSPDGGVGANEDALERVYRTIVGLLGLSSRVALAPGDDAVIVTFGGEPSVEVPLGRKWTKVKRDEGEDYKVRASLDGERLVLERRVKANLLTETFLPPTEPDTLFVVVGLDATGLATGLEFRRAYDALHDTDTDEEEEADGEANTAP